MHRCEILELQGAWPQAQEAAEQACETLAEQRAWDMLGSARYRLAEIHRLRGALGEARSEFGRASEVGRDPEPGMSLLLLAEGRLDLANASIRRVIEEAEIGVGRARVLPAYVEIMLAVGDLPAAHVAAVELSSIASSVDTAFVRALSAYSAGATLLAEGNAPAALETLRGALRGWQEVDAPYEAARVRVLIARACLSLGDTDRASRDLAAARTVFERLGATTEMALVERLSRTRSTHPGGLSPRASAGARAVSRGKDEPRDFIRTRSQRIHGRQARAKHSRQARRLVPYRGQRIRVRAPPRLTHQSLDLTMPPFAELAHSVDADIRSPD